MKEKEKEVITIAKVQATIEIDMPQAIVWYEREGYPTPDHVIRITDNMTINRRLHKNWKKEYVHLMRGDIFKLNRKTQCIKKGD